MYHLEGRQQTSHHHHHQEHFLGCYSVNQAASNELLSRHSFDPFGQVCGWILTLKCFAEQIQSKE